LRLHHISIISQLFIFNNIRTNARYSGSEDQCIHGAAVILSRRLI
jgi:hypothetical protein